MQISHLTSIALRLSTALMLGVCGPNTGEMLQAAVMSEESWGLAIQTILEACSASEAGRILLHVTHNRSCSDTIDAASSSQCSVKLSSIVITRHGAHACSALAVRG